MMNQNLIESMETILTRLDIEFIEYKDRFNIRCPIHQSDDFSMTIYKNTGKFVCWTHRCKHKYNSFLDLIQFVTKTSFKESVTKIEEILNKKIWVPNDKLAISNSLLLTDQIKEHEILCTKEQYFSKMTYPAEYYIKRGFSYEVLEKFGVALCVKQSHPMYMRVVVPIFNKEFSHVIGYMGRSLNPECPICGKYHFINKLCPTNKREIMWASKWINSYGFSSGHYLYNYWNVYNKGYDTINLVEGAGDVWRMYENQIYNTVSIFGCEFTEHQATLLEQAGIYKINLLLDNDEPGMEAKIRIINEYSKRFIINNIEYESKDLGDATTEQIRKLGVL